MNPMLNEAPTREETLLQLERILDAKNEFDKWYTDTLRLYIKMGGQNLKVIPPHMREWVQPEPAKQPSVPALIAALKNVAEHAGRLQRRDFHRERIVAVATEALAEAGVTL